jgi:hypothetical protein
MKSVYTEVWSAFVRVATVSWSETSKHRRRLLKAKFASKGELVMDKAGKFLKQHYPSLLKEFQETFKVR